MIPIKRTTFYRRYKNFGILVTVRILMTVGLAFYNMSLVWYGAHNFSGSTVLGMLLLLYNTPAVITTLLGGWLADSGKSRFVVICASTLAACGLFCSGFVFHRSSSAENILFLSLIEVTLGIALSITGPSWSIASQEFLPASRLALGNSVLTTSTMLASVGAPIVSGILIEFHGLSLPAFLAGGLMLMGSTLFVLLPATAFSRCVTDIRMVANLKEGFGQLRVDRKLWSGFILGAIANLFLLAPQSVLVPKIIVQLHLSPVDLGAYQTATMMGLTVGSLLTGGLSRISPMTLTFAGVFLAAFGSLGWMLSRSLECVVILATVISIGFAVFEVAWTTFMQQNTEKSTRGRLFSIDSWLSKIMRSGGYVVAVGAGSWFGGKVSLTLLASLFGVLTIGLWVASDTWNRRQINGG